MEGVVFLPRAGTMMPHGQLRPACSLRQSNRWISLPAFYDPYRSCLVHLKLLKNTLCKKKIPRHIKFAIGVLNVDEIKN
jgi:hypothetical protein